MRSFVLALFVALITGCGHNDSNVTKTTDPIKKSKVYTVLSTSEFTYLGTDNGIEEKNFLLTRSSSAFSSPVFKAKNGHDEDSVAVYAIYLTDNGKLLIGGNFGFVNGEERNSIVLINKDGSLNKNLYANFNGEVYSIASQKNGEYLIGGYFTKYNQHHVNGLIKINSNGDIINQFDSKFEKFKLAVINHIQIYDRNILLSGLFINRNDEKNGLVVLNTETMEINEELTNKFRIDGHMYKSYITQNGNVIIVGSFDRKSTFKNYIMFDKQGNILEIDRKFPEIEGSIYDIAIKNNIIYIAGDFVAKAGNEAYEDIILVDKNGDITTIDSVADFNNVYSINVMKNMLILSTDNGLITKSI